MGLLVDGRWQNDWYDTKSTGGEFIRKDSQFRHWIGDPDFEAEAGRYHLFVSLACPWAHRTLIFRKLKKLEDKYDEQFHVVFEAIRQLMSPPKKPKPKIGFSVKESRPSYRKRKTKKKR